MHKNIDQHEAKEQLDFIRSIMDDGQRVLADNGFGFILWGFLILGAGLLTLLFDYMDIHDAEGWIYLVCIGIGWVYMIAHRDKERKQTFGNPLTIRIINAIWTAVLLAMTMMGFLGIISETIRSDYICSVLFTTLGIAYYVQGVITGKSWVRNLGFGWWLGAGLLYFINGLWADILIAAMMIGLQIIPGFIFRKQWKIQLAED